MMMPSLPSAPQRILSYIQNSFSAATHDDEADDPNVGETKDFYPSTPREEDDDIQLLIQEGIFTGDGRGRTGLGVPSVLQFLPRRQEHTHSWKQLRKHPDFLNMWTDPDRADERRKWLERCVTSYLVGNEDPCKMWTYPVLGRLEKLRFCLKPEYTSIYKKYEPLPPSCFTARGLLKTSTRRNPRSSRTSSSCSTDQILRHLNTYFDPGDFSIQYSKYFVDDPLSIRQFGRNHISKVNAVLGKNVVMRGGYAAMTSWANVRIL